jgi:pimeloyl-ACP methyl ester carboxylesterase
MRIVYLHGFASSPQSSKAQFFGARFKDLGVPFTAPQLDQGNFEGLTISGQLRVVEEAMAGQPAVLMGSSLGGYLAALYAARHQEVQKLVRLAPAFCFPTRWRARYSTEELELWKRQKTIPFFHYGYKEERGLGFQIVEDALSYEDEPEFRQPALIFHGTQDPVVPAELSRHFAKRHSNVRLRLLDSGHELTDVLDQMWAETAQFLVFQSVSNGPM